MESALRLMRKELVLACKTGHADSAKATHEKWKQHADKVDATCAALRGEIKQHAEETRARHDRQTADLERAHHEAVADLSKLMIPFLHPLQPPTCGFFRNLNPFDRAMLCPTYVPEARELSRVRSLAPIPHSHTPPLHSFVGLRPPHSLSPLAARRIAQVQKTIDATGGRIGAAVHGGHGGGSGGAAVNDSVGDDDTRGSGGGGNNNNNASGAARVHDPKELFGDEGSWQASVSPRTSKLLSKADQELHQTSQWRQQAASTNLTPTQSAAARVQKLIGTDNAVDQEDSETTTSTPPRGAASVVADTLCARDGEAAGDSKDPGSVRAVTPERLRQSLARTKTLQERVRERFEKHMEVPVASDDDNEAGHAPPPAASRTSQTSRDDAAAENTATTEFLSSPFYHSDDGDEEHGKGGATSEEREEGQNEEEEDEEEDEEVVETIFDATTAEEETAEMADARLDREILALHEDLDRETALRGDGGDDDWQEDGHDAEEKSGSATGAGSIGSAAGSAAGSADGVAAGVAPTSQYSQEDASGTTGRIGALSRGRSRSQSGAAGGGPVYNSVAVSPIHAAGYAMESSQSELSCEMEHSSDEDSSDEVGV